MRPINTYSRLPNKNRTHNLRILKRALAIQTTELAAGVFHFLLHSVHKIAQPSFSASGDICLISEVVGLHQLQRPNRTPRIIYQSVTILNIRFCHSVHLLPARLVQMLWRQGDSSYEALPINRTL